MKKSLPQSFIYPSDAVEAIFRIIENGEPAQIFNIASGYFSSDFQVANECVSLFSDKELKLVRQNDIHPLSPMAPTLPKLDIGKLSSLGFESKIDLRSGIKRSCEIIKEGHLC
jgi:nucleoside-diphosphate-sugar epimerase